MPISNFFILTIQMEDTDQLEKDHLRVLVYINGVLDGVMNFVIEGQDSSTLFVHENDQLTLELQKNNKSLGEQQVEVKKMYNNTTDTLKWVKFNINISSSSQKKRSSMILLRLQSTKIGSDNSEEYQMQPSQQQPQQQSYVIDPHTDIQRSASPQCSQCELCQGRKNKSNKNKIHTTELIDLNELIAQIQKEMRSMRLMLKQDLDERQSKQIRKLLLETQQIKDAFLLQAKHWCKHCVLSHLGDKIVRFQDIQKLIGQLALHHLDESSFMTTQSRTTHTIDTLNDRGSPIDQRSTPKRSKTPSAQNLLTTSNKKLSYKKDFVISRLVERLQQQTNGSYPDLNETETLEILVEDLMKENQSLKIENKLLTDLLQDRDEHQQQDEPLNHYNTSDFQEQEQNLDIRDLFDQREKVINELMDKWTGDMN